MFYRCFVSLCVGLAVFAGTGYSQSLDPQQLINPDVLQRALDAQEALIAPKDATGHLVVVDYGRHSSLPRAYIVNLSTGAVSALRTAHGRGSDPDHDGMLDSFSNTEGSNASPEGAFRLAEAYVGKHGASYRLDGLTPANRNARDRAIVVHAGAYAEPDMLARYGRLGRSNGCIVFSQTDFDVFSRSVPEGTLIFIGK